MARVDVHHGEREARRPEGLLRQAQQHDRVLAAREEQHRTLPLGGDLAHDVDRLGLECVEVGEASDGLLGHEALAEMFAAVCSPHSTFAVPDQRP